MFAGDIARNAGNEVEAKVKGEKRVSQTLDESGKLASGDCGGFDSLCDLQLSPRQGCQDAIVNAAVGDNAEIGDDHELDHDLDDRDDNGDLDDDDDEVANNSIHRRTTANSNQRGFESEEEQSGRGGGVIDETSTTRKPVIFNLDSAPPTTPTSPTTTNDVVTQSQRHIAAVSKRLSSISLRFTAQHFKDIARKLNVQFPLNNTCSGYFTLFTSFFIYFIIRLFEPVALI